MLSPEVWGESVQVARVAVLTSTSSFWPPDLDLRPAGPRRWALQLTVQRCKSCGYCAESLDSAPAKGAEIVASLPYRDVLERSKLPRLTRSLFCSALVHESAGDPTLPGWRFLEAAWVCDDAPEPDQARLCRERAIEMFRRSLAPDDVGTSPGVALTLIADLLRRVRRFDDAKKTAAEAESILAELPGDDEIAATTDIARYISTLAAAGDDVAHCCDEAFSAET